MSASAPGQWRSESRRRPKRGHVRVIGQGAWYQHQLADPCTTLARAKRNGPSSGRDRERVGEEMLRKLLSDLLPKKAPSQIKTDHLRSLARFQHLFPKEHS